MTNPTPSLPQLEHRLAELDRRLEALETVVIPLRKRATGPAPAPTPALKPPPQPGLAASTPGKASRPAPEASPPPAALAKPAEGTSLSDLVGGRVLAWVGGIATLLGIGLFLVLAVTRGWIGVEARVSLAAAGSAALMLAGLWLHARRGRTEASVVMVGAATAGLFATLTVASHVYGLLSPEAALLGSVLVGGLATVVAIRWAGYAIAALGLLGSLLTPALVGAPVDATTIAILAVAAACATWVSVRQRWNWLGLTVLLACVPQWVPYLTQGHSPAVDLAVLAWYGGLGLAGAFGIAHRARDERLNAAATLMLTLSTFLVAVAGSLGLGGTLAGHGPELWLAALAIANVAAGAVPRLSVPTSMRRLAMVLGLILTDVAFALTFDGLVLALGWAGAAVAFAALARSKSARERDGALVRLGIGAHVALTLMRAILAAPPATLGHGTPQLVPVLSVAILAAACLACSHLVADGEQRFGGALNFLGLAAIAYLTAATLGGPALVIAWALEALALVQIHARTAAPEARWGAAGFLVLAGLHVMIREAPPVALVTGVASLRAAALGLGAIAVVIAAAARHHRSVRETLLAGSAMTTLYLASVVIVTAFQPTIGGSSDPSLLDLGIRQEGQVLLSGFWSLVGLAALILGLRRNLAAVRTAALAVLLVTVGKVFLYDLSTLTSLYRVASFIALGLLLLAGAFAYQRLRPPPAPDLRSVHPSQR